MAKLNIGLVTSVILTIVLIVMLFTALNDTAADVGSAAANLSESVNGSGACVSGGKCGGSVYPLSSFFKKKGIILLAFTVGIVLVVVRSFMRK